MPRRWTEEAAERLALQALGRSDRTELQLTAWLRRHGISATLSARVVARLRRCGYLDDDAYARRWSEARLRRGPIGRLGLEAGLLRRGVPAALAAQVAGDVLDPLTERQAAERLIALSPGSAPAVLSRLSRAGFSDDIIDAITARQESGHSFFRRRRGTMKPRPHRA
jgi:regulatory protein